MKLLKVNLLAILFILNICMVNANAENEKEIKDFMHYLGNMKSFAVDFNQVDSKGARGNGTLLIDKPMNFRCNYYPPFPLLIVGNDKYISMYDYQMETLSRINASENVFNFLLMNQGDISKHFDFSIVSETENTLKVKLHHHESDKFSEVTIDKASNKLKEIKIFEPNNIITITVNNIRPVSNFDEDLFMLQTPAEGSAPPRLSSQQLSAKYN